MYPFNIFIGFYLRNILLQPHVGNQVSVNSLFYSNSFLLFFITPDGSTKTKKNTAVKWKIYTTTKEELKEKQ